MDPITIINLDLFVAIGASGTVTLLATSLLKHTPFKFEDNRINAAIVSLVSSIIAAYQVGVDFTSFTDVGTIATIIIGTLLVATSTYNNLVKGGQK